MSRLTRKEMKRDEVLDWMGRTVEFVRENARALGMAALAVVVISAIIGAAMSYRGRQSERANTLLTEALALYEAPIDSENPEPDNPVTPSFPDETSRRQRAVAAFEALRAETEGSKVGAIAAAYLGDLAAASEDFEQAESYWRQALAEAGDSLLAGRLQLNLINLGKSQGKGAEVVEELRSLMDTDKSVLSEDVVLFELARALEEIGQLDEARSAYERLLDEHDDSVYVTEARRHLDEL